VDVMKVCSKCLQKKSRDFFAIDRTKPDGMTSQCKECRAVSKRKSYFKSEYGIGVEWIDITYKQQNGCCKVCGEKCEKASLKVDHVHGTNPPILRGLLCNSCNLDLGRVEANIAKYETLIVEAKLSAHYRGEAI
jgi:hypothetical protein